MKKSTRSEMMAAALRHRILEGEWRLNERLPTVDELESLLPASRATIHKGIQSLVEEGYLRSTRGSGVYVHNNTFLRRILVHAGGERLDAGHPFAMVITRKLEDALAAANMQPEIRLESGGEKLDERLARDMAQRRFHGVVSIQSNLPFQWVMHPESKKLRLPMVHVGVHNACPSVFVDMAEFHRLAVESIPLGCKILYLARAGAESTGDGFLALATAHGFTAHLLTDAELAKNDATEQAGYHAFMQAWKRLHGDFGAVVVPDDVVAKGVAQALLALGLRAPDPMRAVVLTNTDANLFYPVPITRVEVDTTQVVDSAMNLLKDSLDGKVSDSETWPRVVVKPAVEAIAVPA